MLVGLSVHDVPVAVRTMEGLFGEHVFAASGLHCGGYLGVSHRKTNRAANHLYGGGGIGPGDFVVDDDTGGLAAVFDMAAPFVEAFIACAAPPAGCHFFLGLLSGSPDRFEVAPEVDL